MANNDTVVRLTPTTDSLSNPDPEVFPLPGGITADPPPPGTAGAPLSRVPLQMRLWEDGGENTVMAFTEQNADAIGLLRVSPTGKKLDEAHVSCNCLQPLGIALDPSGDS